MALTVNLQPQAFYLSFAKMNNEFFYSELLVLRFCHIYVFLPSSLNLSLDLYLPCHKCSMYGHVRYFEIRLELQNVNL